MIAALVLATSGVEAQTSTPGVVPLIEREPPAATKPIAPAPLLVPQSSGVPMPATPTPPPAPVVIPPGPAPVAVPPSPVPGPVFTPATPSVQGSSAPTTDAAKPAPSATEPAKPAPAEAAKPEAPTAPPVAPPTTEPAPPPASTQPVPPAAPSAEAPVPAPVAPAPDKFLVEEVTVAPRPALFVTGVTTWEKAEEQLGGVFAKLGEAATKLGIDKHDGPLVEYIESDSDDVGYRVLLPVDTLPKGKLPKGVKTGQTPAGKALRFRHDGPIEDLEEVYGRIDDEVTKRGVDVRAIVEQYDGDALGSPEDRVVVDVWVFLK